MIGIKFLKITFEKHFDIQWDYKLFLYWRKFAQAKSFVSTLLFVENTTFAKRI